MADKKITALTALVGADVAATDVFAVVDVSATETKKITAEELAVSVANQGLNAGGASYVHIHGVHLPVSTDIEFEGSTNNGFETVLTVVDPTADRTLSLPDETGTIATQAYADSAAAAATVDFADADNILANAVFL